MLRATRTQSAIAVAICAFGALLPFKVQAGVGLGS